MASLFFFLVKEKQELLYALNVPWYLAFGTAGLALARESAVYVGMCPEPDFMSILIGLGVVQLLMALISAFVFVMDRWHNDQGKRAHKHSIIAKYIFMALAFAVLVLQIVGSVWAWQEGRASVVCKTTGLYQYVHNMLMSQWIAMGVWWGLTAGVMVGAVLCCRGVVNKYAQVPKTEW